MSQDEYIDHEVRLRLHDHKFNALEKRLDKMDNKINWSLGLLISGLLIPLILKYLGG
jgi:tetrahydromethanopterin S-methyltransferase subunit G